MSCCYFDKCERLILLLEKTYSESLLKNDFNKQRQHKSNDTILCLIGENAHRIIQNDSDLMYRCRIDNAVVFKWLVRCQMDALDFYTMRNVHA